MVPYSTGQGAFFKRVNHQTVGLDWVGLKLLSAALEGVTEYAHPARGFECPHVKSSGRQGVVVQCCKEALWICRENEKKEGCSMSPSIGQGGNQQGDKGAWPQWLVWCLRIHELRASIASGVAQPGGAAIREEDDDDECQSGVPEDKTSRHRVCVCRLWFVVCVCWVWCWRHITVGLRCEASWCCQIRLSY